MTEKSETDTSTGITLMIDDSTEFIFSVDSFRGDTRCNIYFKEGDDTTEIENIDAVFFQRLRNFLNYALKN